MSFIKSKLAILQKLKKVIDYIFDQLMQVKFTELIFSQGKRIDDRAFDQVRPISVEVGLITIYPWFSIIYSW